MLGNREVDDYVENNNWLNKYSLRYMLNRLL